MASRRLTVKQERFASEYIKDGNASRAVKEAYPNIKTDGARRVMGTKLVANGNVQQKISNILDKSGLTPELIVAELKGLVLDDNKTEKNKAIRTAAEIMGLVGRGGIFAQINLNQGNGLMQEDMDRIRLIAIEKLKISENEQSE